MKTDENGVITLSNREEVATAYRDTLVEFEEAPNSEAAKDAIDHMGGRMPSKAFTEWLSGGALTVTNGEVVATEQPGEESTEEESTESEEESDDDEAGDEEESSSKAEPVSV